MNTELLRAVREFHASLLAGIARDDAMAVECSGMADIAEKNGNQGIADVLRSLSRKHRVKVLELSTKLSLLSTEFREVLGSRD